MGMLTKANKNSKTTKAMNNLIDYVYESFGKNPGTNTNRKVSGVLKNLTQWEKDREAKIGKNAELAANFSEKKRHAEEKRKQAKIINGSGVNIKNCKIKIFSKKKNTNNFIFSGRMIADKGIYELIEAIKIVKEYSSNSNFYFFGLLNVDNPGSISRTTIESWVNEGYINFSPNVKNVHKLLYKFDCFVMPSYSEGMSKSLLEAAAAGLPILCSNIPGCKEVVKNGRNGFLFNPKDIRSLSKAIIKFTHLPTHKRISFGKKSRSIINTNFDEKIITEKYSDYINELLI
jgi:glycosyltransferase involved in cell wall biosynthesis